jgi:hypothetical protein
MVISPTAVDFLLPPAHPSPGAGGRGRGLGRVLLNALLFILTGCFTTLGSQWLFYQGAASRGRL